VRALLRRSPIAIGIVLRVEDLELDRVERAVRRAGRRIDLTPREFALLEYLMRNAGRSVTRAMIIEHVWNFSFDTMTNVVDVYINYLRKKVDQDFEHKLIQTVRNVGYELGTREIMG
jgi:DNA-binding response OmpR family regulator